MAIPVGLNGLKRTNAANAAIKKAGELGLRITSAYRSPEHDKKVGGTGRGYHVLGQALDVAGSKSAMDNFARWAKGSGMFRSVLWQVAGHYDHVHVSWNLDGSQNSKWNEPTNGLVSNGDKGGIVVAIQKLLGNVTADGYFGDKTEAAVKNFQDNRKLQQDGIVGSKTWEELTNHGASFFS